MSAAVFAVTPFVAGPAVFEPEPPVLGAVLVAVLVTGVLGPTVLVVPVVAPVPVFLITEVGPTVFVPVLVVSETFFKPVVSTTFFTPVVSTTFFAPVVSTTFLAVSTTFFTPVSATIFLPISAPMVFVLLVSPVPEVLFVPEVLSVATVLPVPEVLSVPAVTFFAPVNLSIANLVPAPRAAPANALVNLLPTLEPVDFVPVAVGVFAPVTLAAPVPVDVKVLPVVPVVLEDKPGIFDAVLAAVVFPAAVEPFRADVTAVLG